MGYTTEFRGKLNLNKELDADTFAIIKGLNETRRMKRKVDAKYGMEGEFYFEGSGYCGQGDEPNIINHNEPPKTQPGLWCHWMSTPDKKAIEWDGGEKFYDYVEWLEYLIERVLGPKGYTLTGKLKFQGEEMDDRGLIVVVDNKIQVKKLI